MIEFIVHNDDKMLLYNLRFNKKHNEIITLPAPSLFDLTAGHYIVLPATIYAFRGQNSAPEPEPEPPLDPYRPSSYQWDPEEIASQCIQMTLLSTPGKVAAILGIRRT